MCLSEVGLVRTADGREAVVEVDGATRRVSLAPIVLTGGEVRPGDRLLLHTGMAVEVLDDADADELSAFSRLVRDATDQEEP